jgi:hypothetical protein
MNVLRLECDYPNSPASFIVDAGTQMAAKIWTGERLRLDLGFFSPSGAMASLAGIIRVTVAIHSDAGEVLASATTGVVNPSVWLAAWRDKSAQHATVNFTASGLDLPLAAEERGTFPLLITGVNVAGQTLLLSRGAIIAVKRASVSPTPSHSVASYHASTLGEGNRTIQPLAQIHTESLTLSTAGDHIVVLAVNGVSEGAQIRVPVNFPGPLAATIAFRNGDIRGDAVASVAPLAGDSEGFLSFVFSQGQWSLVSARHFISLLECKTVPFNPAVSDRAAGSPGDEYTWFNGVLKVYENNIVRLVGTAKKNGRPRTQYFKVWIGPDETTGRFVAVATLGEAPNVTEVAVDWALQLEDGERIWALGGRSRDLGAGDLTDALYVKLRAFGLGDTEAPNNSFTLTLPGEYGVNTLSVSLTVGRAEAATLNSTGSFEARGDCFDYFTSFDTGDLWGDSTGGAYIAACGDTPVIASSAAFPEDPDQAVQAFARIMRYGSAATALIVKLGSWTKNGPIVSLEPNPLI